MKVFQPSVCFFVVWLTFDVTVTLSIPPPGLSASSHNERSTINLPRHELAKYKPPTQGFGGPPPPVGGATRGGQCEGDAAPNDLTLTGLTPNLGSEDSVNLSYTLSTSPEFLIYLPQTSARQVEFVLKDEDEFDLYRRIFEISGESGIAIVRLPEIPEIVVNKNYHWYFSLICNPNNLRKNVEIDGWVQRLDLDPTLENQLKRADSIARSNLYAEAGIWHEAIATLARLYLENPDNPAVIAEWKFLLESAGLEKFTEVPMNLIELEETPES
ncbi:DUF928 domain-containing protein [Oxynema sp. CENA135]|uniref:DUF928 domain-containing protein n=1 Tax=Oxynema sp. CENA135 TaxID=984206 RepID=UPI00190DFC14|nr:DUF928 domain-containing protein [Oxynema sp. CENA135]